MSNNMHLQQSMEEIYKLLTSDEILLRLVLYPSKLANEDPLDPNLTNILDIPIEERQEMIDVGFLPTDKTYDLDLTSKIIRICFYTGSRKPEQFMAGNGRLSSNPFVSTQTYNFDVYVHVDIDKVDMRKDWICDRLNELLLLNNITDMGKFYLSFSSPISTTPKGFVAYKLAYSCTSSQGG